MNDTTNQNSSFCPNHDFVSEATNAATNQLCRSARGENALKQFTHFLSAARGLDHQNWEAFRLLIELASRGEAPAILEAIKKSRSR